MKFTYRHFKRLSQLSDKTLSFAKYDAISIRRSELIQELCKSHIAVHKDCNANEPGARSWPNQFIATSHILENYMLMRNHKEAKRLLYKFRPIDPDRADRCTTKDNTIVDQAKNEHQQLEEFSFLTQFAFILKKAGYEEVSQEIVIKCLKSQHKYGKIELEVDHKKYSFIRFWTCGRKEIDEGHSEVSVLWKQMFSDNKSKRILHDRVIVASRSKSSSNMILKGFKDIPVDHFESLLPEAKVQIPRGRRWLLNMFLTSTGVIAFFNIGLIILTDLKIDLIWMLVVLSGFIAYRTSSLYKTQRNKYILAWKKMLYYKSTANNAGLVLELINRAHERSLKEALVVYGTALRLADKDGLVCEGEVTRSACDWLSAVNHANVGDLAFSSSFSLLERLGLLSLRSHDRTPERAQFRVSFPEEASERLSYLVQAQATE